MQRNTLCRVFFMLFSTFFVICVFLNVETELSMDKLILKKASTIWREIGQHKKPEELQVEVEIYKKMLDLFQVGDYCYFIFSPPEMRIEYTNDSILKLLGYPPEEFTLEKFLGIIHPDDLETYLNFEATITQFWQNLPTEKVFKYKTRYDFRLCCKDGTVKSIIPPENWAAV